MKRADIDIIMDKLGTVEKFYNFLDSLCITDRQKEIARLKYIRAWANQDIAEELFISRRTVASDMKIIHKRISDAMLNMYDVDKR